ncbi:MAG: nucleotide pyrophosphohydrolase [Rhodoferax ferrireducens]|uniref:Nucleotide pyrophosphohydrolase n=1 Tax=Rhodoferax ferrireducens TaxID=192843 RepID=A0A1W9KUV5_9BURK|nr:MAG: nucleotide pyrophosphohydrolase [Rhodoferax ferrireducens]
MLNDLLRQELLEFRQVRDWEQFHNPRNLATALMVEAAELLEPFRWASEAQAQDIVKERRGEIADELADIAILLTYLTHDLGIDLNAAVASKIRANAEKYPVDKARGSNKKYTEL